MYHSISQSANPKFKQFAVPVTAFSEQMAYLYRHRYTPITVTRLIQTRSEAESVLPERPVVLTFDDGYADFFTAALPVLQKYGFPATLYMATAFINGTSEWLQREGEATRPILAWEQLRETIRCGIECGAHSHSHPQLDMLPCSLAQGEIILSKKLLERHLDQEIFSFAYPYGYYNAQLPLLLQAAGFTSACAVKHHMYTGRSNLFALPRLMVAGDTTISSFAALLTGASSSPGATVHRLYAHARTPVWRVIRQCSTSVTRYIDNRRRLAR